MTPVSPSAVTDPASPANSSEGAFTAREERLRALMLQAQAGDEAAYRVVLTELSEHLRAYYRRRLASIASEAEDLVQETLLAIHNQRHTYDRSRPLTAWCYAIARYKLVDFLRRRGRREGLNDSIDDDFAAQVSTDETDATDTHRDLQQLLDALPERQRLSVVYVKIEGRSVAETAALTGMSESAIKVNVHRALKALAAKVRGSK
jgi:RNA polymerase sigma-70 factor (ECF subfamily)